MFYNSNTIDNKSERGFSLLEVLITSAIIGIVTAISIFKYGAFNSVVLLKNQAYEIALSLREAQVYSISIRGRAGGSGYEYREEYGINFDLASGPAQQITLFLDSGSGSEGRFDESGDVTVDTVTFDSRFEIDRFCVMTDGGTYSCSDTHSLGNLAVVFQRPDFDAGINVTDLSGNPIVGTYVEASTTLVSVENDAFKRTVVVGSTGQISVQ